ncbi:hypothetical protein NL676_013404 [Syzygium grande]|nr:hypothetical protein NL676_013404 [Syzygium grande]
MEGTNTLSLRRNPALPLLAHQLAVETKLFRMESSPTGASDLQNTPGALVLDDFVQERGDFPVNVVCFWRNFTAALSTLVPGEIIVESLEDLYSFSSDWQFTLLKLAGSHHAAICMERGEAVKASVRCPHGQLMPELAAGARRLLAPEILWLFFYKDAVTVSLGRRLLVPEILWLFFYEEAVTVDPDDPSGRSSFPLVQSSAPSAVRKFQKWHA